MLYDQEITIDPFLLCLPNPCSSVEQLEDFINALVGWQGLIKQGGACVLMSDSARIALSDDDEYPHRHRLSDLLKRHQCDIADENTISKLANGILEKTPSFEEYYGIDALLIDEQGITIDPALIVTRLKPKCRLAFRETLATIAIINQMKPKDTSETMLVASAFGKDRISPLPEEIAVESEIHEVSFMQRDRKFPAELPIKAVDKIPISFSHDELLNRLGVWKVWNNACDEPSVTSAISLCVQNLIASGVSDALRLEYILGPNFLGSVRECGAATRSDYAMVIIESCARIILGIPKNPLKPFRVDSKATSGQRIRGDGSLAYRTHLTQRGVALRLMLWKRPNGLIEFANVGTKGALEIL